MILAFVPFMALTSACFLHFFVIRVFNIIVSVIIIIVIIFIFFPLKQGNILQHGNMCEYIYILISFNIHISYYGLK